MSKPAKIRREGREAYYPYEDPAMLNPYAGDDIRSDDWLEGWKEAEVAHEAEIASLECPQCKGRLMIKWSGANCSKCGYWECL